jgi:hypothetical protein
MILCCLANDKEKRLYMFSTDAGFFLSVINPQLVDSMGAEAMDTVGELYLVLGWLKCC